MAMIVYIWISLAALAVLAYVVYWMLGMPIIPCDDCTKLFAAL
jgi:hypothetical protein